MMNLQKARKNLTLVAGALGLAFNGAACTATIPTRLAPPQSAGTILKFYNVHTGESITVPHTTGDKIGDAVNIFMRDYRRNEKADMSPRLFDLLERLQSGVQQRFPNLQVTFQVVSSYRAPETNAALQAAGGTQADNSQHIHGNAMDIIVPGVPTAELRDIATCLKGGGVGYYEQDGFVHVDVGRVRYWPSHDYLKNLKCAKP